MDESYKNYGLKVINELRKNNINVHFDYKYNLKKSLSLANQLNHEYALIIGENELKNNQCTIKNLYKNFQKTVSIEQLIQMLI